MRSRILDPADKDYPHYGGRGLGIEKDWAEDFEPFYEWSVANGYFDGATLDRINNNRGYLRSNLRWADRRGQAYNRTTNRMIFMDGQVRTLEEWCAMYGTRPDRAIHRMEDGWSQEDAIKTPIRGTRGTRAADSQARGRGGRR